MARYYRTASARPLDYMYQANIPLMERVIGANDQFITENLQGLGQLGQLAGYNHLLGDSEDAQKIISGYRNEIDTLTKTIQEDPANWRKQADPIRNLSRKLQTDYESGPIGKQVANYNARKSAFDAVDKQVELYHTSGGTKGVDPTRADAYKKAWDEKFTKTDYNPSTGSYNTYRGGSVMDNIDIKKTLADGLDKIKADKSYQYEERPDGTEWYLNKVTNKKEQITPDKVLQIATDNITPQLMDYLRQDSEVGLIKGVYDDKGNFIMPYSYTEVGLTPEETAAMTVHQRKIDGTKDPALRQAMQQQLDNQVAALKSRQQLDWNNESYLAPILRGLSETYSYSNTEQGNDLTANPKGAAMFREANANQRQANQLAQQYKIHQEKEAGLKDRFDRKLNLDKDKFEFSKLPKDKDGKVKATKEGEKLPLETGVSRLATNSFEDWSTYDTKTGKPVPVLSNAGLSSDIDTKKKELASIDITLNQLNKTLKNKPDEDDYQGWVAYNQAKLQQQQLLSKKGTIQGELNDRRQYYAASTDAVLTNHPKTGVKLLPEEVSLYKEFDKDRDGTAFRRNIEELKKKYPDVLDERSSTGAGVAIYKEAPEVEAARDKWVKYTKVKALVDKGRDKILTGIRSDIIDNDAIQLGDKDSRDVSDILLSNTRGIKLFDSFGESTNEIELEGKGISFFNPKGDNYKLSFDNDSLKDYMNRYNVKMNVKKVANTTKIGSGNAVAEITFDDPTGNIKSGRSYYIEMTPEMQKTIAGKFKNSKNTDVAAIATSITDDESNAIRKQLLRPGLSNTLGEGSDNSKVFRVVVTSKDGRKIPLTVSKFSDDGSSHLQVSMKDNEGNDVPFPTTNGIPGFFNGIEDFISQFKQQKYK